MKITKKGFLRKYRPLLKRSDDRWKDFESDLDSVIAEEIERRMPTDDDFIRRINKGFNLNGSSPVEAPRLFQLGANWIKQRLLTPKP